MRGVTFYHAPAAGPPYLDQLLGPPTRADNAANKVGFGGLPDNWVKTVFSLCLCSVADCHLLAFQAASFGNPYIKMSPREFNALHVVHVSGVLILLSFTFLAFAASPESKRRVLTIAGLGSLLVLITGLRMWQAQFNFVVAGWILVKILCWLGVSALSGLGYRLREKAGLFALLALVLAIAAVAMAYVKPF